MPTRQQLRLRARQEEWATWRTNPHYTPIGQTDDHGVIRRKVRRAISAVRAKGLAKRLIQEAKDQGRYGP